MTGSTFSVLWSRESSPMADKPPYFTRAQWFAMPLKLRQRWWKETSYSEWQPSADLLEACDDAIDGKPDG